MEVLSAYVRENARWAPKEVDKGQDKEQDLPRPPADIQAVLDVLDRLRKDPELQQYLSPLDLRGTDLRRADLQNANLYEADLQGAFLLQAILQGAYLQEAHVTEKQLDTALSLEGATMPDGTVQD